MSIDPVRAARLLFPGRVVSARVTSRTPIAYDPYLAGRKVERVIGLAELADGVEARWAAVAKVTTGAGIRSARRELAAYRDGIAPVREVTGLRAPALLGWTDEHERV